MILGRMWAQIRYLARSAGASAGGVLKGTEGTLQSPLDQRQAAVLEGLEKAEEEHRK